MPESPTWEQHDSYDEQVAWELEALKQASIIVFWIPREIETMPAFTTNVEFGFWAQSGKVMLGAPTNAPKMKYLRELAKRYSIPTYNDLDSILAAAVQACNTIENETVTKAHL